MSATSATVWVRRRLATGSGRVDGLPGSLRTLRCGRGVGGTARMIDVRFMVSIVCTRDSSNHSHDHTHDHDHRRPEVSDDSPDHSLPQVSASEHTRDHSHALRIAAWVGSTSSGFKPLGRRDHDPTRPCPVDDATGLSAMLKAHVRVGVGHRSAIEAHSELIAGRGTQPAGAALAAGWAAADFEPLADCDCADVFDLFDNRVELRRPAT